MAEVKFENRRFEPELTPFLALAKEMAKAFGYTADLSVNKELAQLLRLRVAQRNECAYCVILHAATARDKGIHPSKVDNISSWWQSELYTDAEKAALVYADSLTDGKDPEFQQKHEQMTMYYSEVEIAEVAAIVINMNVWTRLKLAQGETPVFANSEA